MVSHQGGLSWTLGKFPEKEVLKEGWSLIRVVFHGHWESFQKRYKKRGGLSSGWSFMDIGKVFKKGGLKRGVVSHQGGLSWTLGKFSRKGVLKVGWSLIRVVFHGTLGKFSEKGV